MTGSRPTQRWYQASLQDPKQRAVETEWILLEEREEIINRLQRISTIHNRQFSGIRVRVCFVIFFGTGAGLGTWEYKADVFINGDSTWLLILLSVLSSVSPRLLMFSFSTDQSPEHRNRTVMIPEYLMFIFGARKDFIAPCKCKGTSREVSSNTLVEPFSCLSRWLYSQIINRGIVSLRPLLMKPAQQRLFSLTTWQRL
ncbi:hypothetical protein L1987_11072 [Smallanthus sonchifolius]|uniref:Uncharacterized protein n=1 Tax=Smallanthus sonchifolius TaxID=185202 RepID=A0ACB9J9Y3_9ASTR|nr:hypothetical protein L1987_11072 [Smallanthus sonchifolius]